MNYHLIETIKKPVKEAYMANHWLFFLSHNFLLHVNLQIGYFT